MNNNGKSLENWIWDAACSIRGAKDAATPRGLPPVYPRTPALLLVRSLTADAGSWRGEQALRSVGAEVVLQLLVGPA